MSAPTLTQAEYKRLKTRLSRHVNHFTRCKIAYSKARGYNDHQVAGEALRRAAACLRDEAIYGLDIFDREGYPDAWHRWQVAKGDAEHALQVVR